MPNMLQNDRIRRSAVDKSGSLSLNGEELVGVFLRKGGLFGPFSFRSGRKGKRVKTVYPPAHRPTRFSRRKHLN